MRQVHLHGNHHRVQNLGAVLLCVFFCFASMAQRGSSEPPPARAADAQNPTTIRTKVRQVLLDVVVTDRKNHPVTGLSQKDFSILEDGKPQQILSFEARTNTMGADAAPQLPKLPPNTFLSAATPQDSFPLNVLLYDILNTPVDDQTFAREEMVKFLATRPPRSRFAIFVLSDKVHLLQGFTDDDELLVSSVNRKEASTATTSLASGPIGTPTLAESLSDSRALTANQLEQLTTIDQLERVADSYFLSRRVEKTLSAFSEISHFLSGWSGRKNLIWLSGGFPAGVLPSGEVLDPFAATANYSPEIHEAVDRLTLSQIAIYPVDIRGLMVDPVFSAANSRRFRSQGSFAQAQAKFARELAADHDTMDELAKGSGGHAFYNSNGLAQAIATAVEDGANYYYTLSYSPTNKNFDGGSRKIRVKLSRSGYSLSYRRSYFADDENKFLEKAADVPFVHIQGGMERGAPLAHEILFTVRVTANDKPSPVTPELIDELSQFKAFGARKKWDDVRIQRYSLEYWIPGEQLQFAVLPDGTRGANLQFLAEAYDAEGTPMYGKLFASDEAVPADKFEKVRHLTFHGLQQFDAPAQAAWLRLAIRDPEHNRVGAVEIRLPLLPEPPSPAANLPHQ